MSVNTPSVMIDFIENTVQKRGSVARFLCEQDSLGCAIGHTFRGELAGEPLEGTFTLAQVFRVLRREGYHVKSDPRQGKCVVWKDLSQHLPEITTCQN